MSLLKRIVRTVCAVIAGFIGGGFAAFLVMYLALWVVENPYDLSNPMNWILWVLQIGLGVFVVGRTWLGEIRRKKNQQDEPLSFRQHMLQAASIAFGMVILLMKTSQIAVALLLDSVSQ